MEPRFGHDFSKVRVHADTLAASSANAVGALAYTVGQDLVFAPGRYAPRTAEGRGLLAHELAHSLQQPASSVMDSLSVSPSNSPLENAAEHAARRALAGHGAPSVMRGTSGLLQRAGADDAKSTEQRKNQEMAIQPGDVLVRAGTFSGKNPLVQIIGEPYNHGGVAIDSSNVHHVESKGYETVSVKTFFAPENASSGAQIRFQGPFAERIRPRVAEIAKNGRYKKIPGNPFSTAENLKTVNCNEFTHELHRQAIAETMSAAQTDDKPTFEKMAKEYSQGNPAQVKDLIAAKDVEFSPGTDVLGTAAAVGVAELAGRQSLDKSAVSRGEVRVEFEGKIEQRNYYPADWGRSWNPFKLSAYKDGFYAVAVLRAYTPDSFVNSKYFSLVRKFSSGGP
jgi:hypothetical protein